MNKLDPAVLFERIAQDVPTALHEHLFVTGSLAAAYHYKTKLKGHAVNTKDADLVVHPAGDIDSCSQMAEQLRDIGWHNTDQCYPRPNPHPVDDLRYIRLFPPASSEYFIEFLNIPTKDQAESKSTIGLKLKDGWYGLPSFRFLGIVSIGRLTSHIGLEYAHPAMMALTNLLSHPVVGSVRIESGDMLDVLRSAKDLGRVIALARLAGRKETEMWRDPCLQAIQECFPAQWKELLHGLGTGLEELLEDKNALDDARKTTDSGLLSGMNVSNENLRAIGQQLLQDLIFPLREHAS